MAIDMAAPPGPAIDPDKLNAFVGKMLGDLGAAASAALVIIGDKLGLYRELARGEALSAAELAAKTGTAERYVREWLANQAAGGYLPSARSCWPTRTALCSFKARFRSSRR